jgi:hypothetical protein
VLHQRRTTKTLVQRARARTLLAHLSPRQESLLEQVSDNQIDLVRQRLEQAVEERRRRQEEAWGRFLETPPSPPSR